MRSSPSGRASPPASRRGAAGERRLVARAPVSSTVAACGPAEPARRRASSASRPSARTSGRGTRRARVGVVEQVPRSRRRRSGSSRSPAPRRASAPRRTSRGTRAGSCRSIATLSPAPIPLAARCDASRRARSSSSAQVTVRSPHTMRGALGHLCRDGVPHAREAPAGHGVNLPAQPAGAGCCP